MEKTQTPLGIQLRFGLSDLLEYVTICALLCAVATVTGLLASASLMLLALALWMRLGSLALAAFAAASLAADVTLIEDPESSTGVRQIVVLLLGGVLCSWSFRKHRKQHRET